MSKGYWALGFVLGLAAAPARAAESEHEQRRERFGNRGQIVVTGDFELGADATQGEFGTSTIDIARIVVAPAADVFVIERLSIGGQLLYKQSSTSGWVNGERVSIGLGPRVGYAVPLSELWSLYPRVGLSYERELGDFRTERVTTTASVPVLVHPAEHFFLGAGPYLSRELVDYGNGSFQKFNTYGVKSTIGGYF